MSYEYRLEDVDPEKSDALGQRIKEQHRREREAWGEADDETAEKLPAQPTQQNT